MTGLILAPGEQSPRRIVDAIRQILEGRSNAVGSCTLAANAATTTVKAINCGPNSAVFLFPQTAHAAAEIAAGGVYIGTGDIRAGQFVVHHANNAQADRTFFFVCLG